jgi:hypothetical protein
MNKKCVLQSLSGLANEFGIIFGIGNPNLVTKFDNHLFEDFGLECTSGVHYNIVDESKFNLFMLKYPHHINKISHE